MTSSPLRRTARLALCAASLAAAFAASPALSQTCPTGTSIPNFRFVSSTSGGTRQITYAWDAPAGTPAGTVYQVLRATAGGYCSAFADFVAIAETTGNTQTVTLDVPDRAYQFWVRVKGCPQVSAPNVWVDDSFTQPPSAPVLSASSPGGNQVDLTILQNDERTAAVVVERAGPDGVYRNVETVYFQDLCPPGRTRRIVDSGLAPGTYTYRAWAINQGSSGRVFSNIVTLVVGDPLPGPGAVASTLVTVTSAPGLNGAFFRTSVQLYNPTGALAFGRLVFHTREQSGSERDPFVRYALQPLETIEFHDVLAVLGITGNGSLDIVPEGGEAPVARARVYNDAGSLGTMGVTEDALLATDALEAGSLAVLLAPADFSRFRFSLGVRTLANGATITFTLRSASGQTIRRIVRSYPGTYYVQRAAADFLDGAPLAGNESVTVEVNAGSAFVYATVADNLTNDPSIQMARRRR